MNDKVHDYPKDVEKKFGGPAPYTNRNDVWVIDMGGVEGDMEIPVAYCPYCGEKLTEQNNAN